MQLLILYFWPVCLAFLCLNGLTANAATHYLMPANPNAANPYTSWETAGTSVIDVVNAAMTNATMPRTVMATNGIYFLTNTVTITNDVTLQGVNGRDTTIFNGAASFFFILKHPLCILNRLTVTNGAGGIKIAAGTVTNCLITGCLPVILPGAISGINIGSIAGPAIIANSMISGNVTRGISVFLECAVMNCTIENNNSPTDGAGIYCGDFNAASMTFRNCLIRNNVATNTAYGGGIRINQMNNVNFANCTIVSNIAKTAGGGLAISGFLNTNAIVNCIIQSNACQSGSSQASRNIHFVTTTGNNTSSVGYSCSTSNSFFVLDSRGNTTNDPGFVGFAKGNYRLNSRSPCFNSGTNEMDWMISAVDLDGHARILHGQADMGAYELFIPSGTMFRFR